jgi:hypothetical protein
MYTTCRSSNPGGVEASVYAPVIPANMTPATYAITIIPYFSAARNVRSYAQVPCISLRDLVNLPSRYHAWVALAVTVPSAAGTVLES